MAYPDWVLKHKKKGTYINKAGNKCYLYVAHSEHIPGTTNKSRRICDSYLGSITETHGFIPKKQKEAPAIMEYGLSCAITSLCKKPFLPITLDYPNTYKEIIIRAILLFIYEENIDRLKHLSFITTCIMEAFPIDEEIEFLIQRTSRMINSTLSKLFPDPCDFTCFITVMRSVQIVKIKKEWVISSLDDNTKNLISSLHIDFEEDELWKKLKK